MKLLRLLPTAALKIDVTGRSGLSQEAVHQSSGRAHVVVPAPCAKHSATEGISENFRASWG